MIDALVRWAFRRFVFKPTDYIAERMVAKYRGPFYVMLDRHWYADVAVRRGWFKTLLPPYLQGRGLYVRLLWFSVQVGVCRKLGTDEDDWDEEWNMELAQQVLGVQLLDLDEVGGAWALDDDADLRTSQPSLV